MGLTVIIPEGLAGYAKPAKLTGFTLQATHDIERNTILQMVLEGGGNCILVVMMNDRDPV